jgi:hypothetical protein
MKEIQLLNIKDKNISRKQEFPLWNNGKIKGEYFEVLKYSVSEEKHADQIS